MNQLTTLYRTTVSFGVCITFLCLQGVALAQAAESDAGAQTDQSVFSLLLKGGPVMIPLGLCSVIALTVFFERFATLRRGNIVPANFLAAFREKMAEKGQTVPQALDDIPYQNTMVGDIVRTGTEKIIEDGITREYVEKLMEDRAGRQIRQARRSLLSLKIIATITPLMGLLGTMYGMINTFRTVAEAQGGFGRAEQLSEGIYEALVTTATGLTVAVPVLVLHFILSRKIDGFADDIEEVCDGVLEDLYSHGTTVTQNETRKPQSEAVAVK